MNLVIHGQCSRGQPVRLGNVYAPKHSHRKRRWDYKVVVSLMPVDRFGHPWLRVVCVYVNSGGTIMGCCMLPEAYVSDHHDLVGYVPEAEHKYFRFNVLCPQQLEGG